MCSIRWERPASSSPSPTLPAPIQNPSATDRTESMDSVTTRTPESSSVSLGAVRVPPRAPARAAGAAAAAVPPVAAVTAVAAGGAAVAAAAADAGQLLGGLARDVGGGGQAQADAAALAVDLDDPHGDLVAAVEHLLDRGRPLAGRDVGDVQQPVGALGQLDERAEGRRLDDLALELVADLDLLGHLADPRDEGVALLAVGGVDEHGAVVVDVDLGLELLLHPADRLAALADDHADLRGVDLDALDARRVERQLAARRLDDLGHLAEDELARIVGLGQRVAQDVEGDTRDLDVHLQRGDAAIGAGDLEVHVAEVVLDAGDVGEDGVVVPLLDEAHGDAGDGPLERHARVHQRQRRAAHRGHRG